MTLFAWILYGLLTASIVYVFFPNNLLGVFSGVLIVSLFVLLGSMDMITSHRVEHI